MKWRAVVLVAAVGAVAADDDKSKRDLDALQGTWQVQRMTSNGREAPAAEAQKLRFVITGSKLIPYQGDEKGPEFSLSIRTAGSPAALNLKSPDGKEGKGIYRLEGDTLTLCIAEPGKDRPKEFTSAMGSRLELMALKRVKK
jgi:uncharacterized protein (TIGR03067 family)